MEIRHCPVHVCSNGRSDFQEEGNSVEEDERSRCEGQVMGSPPRQWAGSFCIVYQEVHSQVQHPTVRASVLLAGSWALRLLSAS
ncbi:hypothetical protein TNCV_3564121 [Trichonephila clavipes]|nr:hypothetical protein TNCV_3564121 [Trichonephila clavipes]